jgi:L,D-transpeptidase YcbB
VDPAVFDAPLQAAVIRFQRRHGLETDGAVGPITLAELDRPVAERIRQIERNLERWRWLPHDLGSRYILVDIAGFELRVFEDEHMVMDMQVIVGRDYRQTPVFNDQIRYLVLSPYWNVPASLAVKDILPLARSDPRYLQEHGFKVLAGGWGADARVVDATMVDWENISESNFPYRFRQDPGPYNSLGRVKFMFPNEFDVYLHDTPSVGLFARTSRDISSGCIRLERPLDLAEYLLDGASGWTRERILSGMNSGKERNITLPTPVPVHMIYLTVWTEPDGTAYFRPDVYGRDARLDTALSE